MKALIVSLTRVSAARCGKDDPLSAISDQLR
jgi:hypothetical protein